MNKKPASIGALVMLGGGLLLYWAFSQFKLFGLGNGNTDAVITKRMGNVVPKNNG